VTEQYQQSFFLNVRGNFPYMSNNDAVNANRGMSFMSDNPRMKKWLEMMEEGRRSNVISMHEYDKKPKVIQQNILYVTMQKAYVGFWRRLFASIMDNLLLVISLTVLFSFLPQSSPGVDVLLIILICVLYYTIFPTTNLQGTIGKLAIGAKIVDANGNKVSIGQSFLRFIGQIISAIILFFGFIMIASHWQKRALHDMMAGTYVINRDK
jgi:uncharacterized RDD family membrane protein YckC